MNRTLPAALAAALLLLPLAAFADQTYFVSGDGAVYVENPGNAAIYNRSLTGKEQEFAFPVIATGTVRVRLAVPERDGNRSVTAQLVDGFGDPVVALVPGAGEWKPVDDPRTGRYLVGAEFAGELTPDTYSLKITSPDASGAYAVIMDTLTTEGPSVVPAADEPHKTRNQVIVAAILAVFAGAVVTRIMDLRRWRG